MNQKLSLAHQQMTADYEKMRQEEADISAKLQERMSVAKSGRHSHKRRVLANNQDNSFGGGGDTNLITGYEGDQTQEEISVGGLDKNWLICDKGIVTEGDKKRLFSVIMNAKRRKEMLNLSEKHLKEIEGSDKENKNAMNSRRVNRKGGSRNEGEKSVVVAGKKRNFRGLVRDVLEQLPFALPTLQLHIILSLTMVLLTHQCPVASYFIAV